MILQKLIFKLLLAVGNVFEYTQDNQEQLTSDLQNNINNLS